MRTVTPEAARYLEKARQCLANGKASLGYGLSNDAGRGAYLAAFHAAQAFIFESTGRAAKTHQGVQREYYRLAQAEPRIDKAFAPFLGQAYNLKAVADYETGPDSEIPPEKSAGALETATRFVDLIARLLAENSASDR
ncbi:MAG: HEPN domain-containing protein [Methylotetracoccus sp.]|nr:HEPN domain-containing protein [Methylotetracoccus sp.]